MAAMLIYGKNLKKSLLLRHHWADCLEMWYVATGMSLVDFDLLYGKVKFSPLGF